MERDGVEKAYPQYAAQIWIYQAYLDVTENPAILTAVNADTCERLHMLVPFNVERAQAWSDRAAKDRAGRPGRSSTMQQLLTYLGQ